MSILKPQMQKGIYYMHCPLLYLPNDRASAHSKRPLCPNTKLPTSKHSSGQNTQILKGLEKKALKKSIKTVSD